jgi:hypothetical protein
VRDSREGTKKEKGIYMGYTPRYAKENPNTNDAGRKVEGKSL